MALTDKIKHGLTGFEKHFDAAMAKGEEVIDSVFAELESDLDEVFNQVQYIAFSYYDENGQIVCMSKENAKAEVTNLFEQVKAEVNGYAEKFSGNEIAEAIVPKVVEYITKSGGIIDTEQQKIMEIIDTAPEMDIGGAICNQMLQIKYNLISEMQGAIDDSLDFATDAVNKSVEDVKTYLTEQATACTTKMTEEAASKIKENVAGKLNEFSEKYLNDSGASKVDLGKNGGGDGKTTGKNVASMIKFGYKDYLMLFVFIGVCGNDTAVLSRVGDLIQLNFSFDRSGITEDTSGQILISHKKGADFKLSDAKTYVSVKSTVKLDMLFLDMDFFNRLLIDEGEDVDSMLKTATEISYKGVAGY